MTVGENSEHWGWELRTPEPPVPTPFEEEPPAPAIVQAPWSRRLAARRERMSAGWYAHVRRFAGLLVVGVLAWLSTLLPESYGGWITLGLVAATGALVFVAIRPLVLPFWGDLRYRRWRTKVLVRQRAVAERTEHWERRREQHEEQLSARSRPERWAPLKPATTHRVDIYGGDPRGCEALLLSVAGSILESERPVTVVDLSQDGISHALVRKAINDRRQVYAAMLPPDLPAVGLLDGLTSEDVGGVVAEAVHVLERDASAGGDKALDTTLIDQVRGCVRGPLTFRRLYEAVRVVAHQDSRPEDMDKAEYDRLSDLLGEGARRSVEARLFRLSAALQQLAALEPQGPRASATEAAEHSQLIVWDLSERVGDVGGELLAHVTFQALVHRLRQERLEEGRVLVVLGADRFRRTHIERLDQLARRRGVRLVLFFRHLREDAVELLGGGEAVMFMRLGNAKEAESAATFIGRGHRLVVSQFTVQHSSSLSTTVGSSTSETTSEQESSTKGKQWSRTRGYQYGAMLDFPHDSGSVNKGGQRSTTTGTSTSSTRGESESSQTGTSESRSMGYQRVYEFAVEPRFLQALAPTAFVLVDPRDPGSPRIGDASPDLEAMQATGMHVTGMHATETSGFEAAHAVDPDQLGPSFAPGGIVPPVLGGTAHPAAPPNNAPG